MKSVTRPGVALFFVVLVPCVAWWIYFALETRIRLEDALITFRYAGNIATGRGFVFNEGERVLGTTTPLQTLILAAVGALFGTSAIPACATLLMSLLGVCTAIGNHFVLKRAGYSAPTCAFGMLTFLANGRIVQTSIGGMETPLVVLLMCVSAYAVLREQGTLAVVACSLLTLTRPDGLVWSGLVVGALLLQRRVPYRGFAVGGALLFAWIAFAFAYFGSPIPHSIIAKRVVLSNLTGEPWWAFVGWYLRTLSVRPDSPTFLLWALAFAVGVRMLLRPGPLRPLGLVLTIYPVAYGLVLFAGHAPLFGWYRTPPMWDCMLVVSIGLGQIAELLTKKLARWVPGGFAGVACSVALGAIFVVGQQNLDELNIDRRYQENEDGTRKVVGLWLRDHTPATSIIAMEAIGYQGYYSDRKVIDLAGLVSPAVVALRRESSSNAQVLNKVLSRAKPDYLVLRSFEVEKNLHFNGGPLFENDAQREYFEEHYRLKTTVTAPHPEDWGMVARVSVYGREKP